MSELKGKTLSSYGNLIEDASGIKLNIPMLKTSFKVTGLEDCQTVFCNQIIFIGVFEEEDMIHLLSIDDYPSGDVCVATGDFIAIAQNEKYYYIAVKTERCGVSIVDGKIRLNTRLNGEKLFAEFPEENDLPKTEDELSNYFNPGYEKLAFLRINKEDATLDPEKKEIRGLVSRYSFK